MGDFFKGENERIVDGTRYVKYLDLNKWYGIVVPKDEIAYKEMCDYKVWDDDNGDIREICLRRTITNENLYLQILRDAAKYKWNVFIQHS